MKAHKYVQNCVDDENNDGSAVSDGKPRRTAEGVPEPQRRLQYPRPADGDRHDKVHFAFRKGEILRRNDVDGDDLQQHAGEIKEDFPYDEIFALPQQNGADVFEDGADDEACQYAAAKVAEALQEGDHGDFQNCKVDKHCDILLPGALFFQRFLPLFECVFFLGAEPENFAGGNFCRF